MEAERLRVPHGGRGARSEVPQYPTPRLLGAAAFGTGAVTLSPESSAGEPDAQPHQCRQPIC